MVSKQFTLLSMLMPIAMSLGTLISIYAYKSSHQGLAIVTIVSSTILFIMLFYIYGRKKRRY